MVLPSHLQQLPEFQTALAQTGNLSIRCASKQFNTMFNEGLRWAWSILKKDTNDSTLLVFMEAIEAHQVRTSHSYLRSFQLLKKEVHRHWNQQLFFVDPSVDLPTHCSFFGLLGLTYRSDYIPKKVQERAQEIEWFKTQLVSVSVPKHFLDAKTQQIMALPVFDASHFEFLETFLEEYAGLQRKSIHQLCHTREQFNCGLVEECSLCQHPIDQKASYIATVLQEEIHVFLKKKVEQKLNLKTKWQKFLFMLKQTKDHLVARFCLR
jgi:hypothetical protein